MRKIKEIRTRFGTIFARQEQRIYKSLTEPKCSVSRKNKRSITVDGTEYLWRVSADKTVEKEIEFVPFLEIIEPISRTKRYYNHVRIAEVRSRIGPFLSSATVTPRMVAALIREDFIAS